MLSIAQISCCVVAISNVFKDAQKSISPFQSSSFPQELNLLDYLPTSGSQTRLWQLRRQRQLRLQPQ